MTVRTPPHVVADVRLHVGESPVWDGAAGALWFTDLMPGRIYRLDLSTAAIRSIEVGQPIGAVVLREGGGLVAAVRDGIALVDPDSGELEMISPIEGDDPGNRMNDAKCDPAGRLWAGTMSFEFTPGAGSLYRIDPDGTSTRAVDGLTISNGLGWSPDGERLYHVDTAAGALNAFDFDLAAGTVSNRRRLVDFDPTGGMPDGLAIDADGFIWVAMFGGGCVRRFAPDGAPAGQIDLPVAQVTSVAFGGADLADLFVTTARYELTDAQLEEQPEAGAVFACQPGVAGLPVSPFAG